MQNSQLSKALQIAQGEQSKIEKLISGTNCSLGISKILEDHNKIYKMHVQPFESLMKNVQMSLPSFSLAEKIAQNITPLSLQFLEYKSPLEEAFKKMQSNLSLFSDIAEQTHAFHSTLDFGKINETLSGFTNALRNIPRERFAQIRLSDEYWLVEDMSLLLQIDERPDLEGEALSAYIIQHYKENDWERLDQIVASWDGIVVPDRIAIFVSALKHTRTASDEDIHLITVPTLIAQIDGLIKDLYSLLPAKTKKRIKQEIFNSLPEDVKSKRGDPRKEITVGSIAEIVDFWSAELFQEAIYEGLFKNSNQVVDIESDPLSRHKIIHGDRDFLRYGYEVNFVRLFLYADFIANLSLKISRGEIIIEEAA